MPKQKVRKSMLKRFKITKTGKVLRARQMAGHRKAHKSKRQIRSLRKNRVLSAKQARRIKKFIV